MTALLIFLTVAMAAGWIRWVVEAQKHLETLQRFHRYIDAEKGAWNAVLDAARALQSAAKNDNKP